jgi:plastocyanin
MVVAALIVTACSGAAATPAPATAAPATAAPATAAPASAGGAAGAVSIKGFAFNPAESTTTAGGTVTWTNEDDAPHTVTFDDASITSSGNINKAGTFAATFAVAGTFTYKCTIHPTMTGTVKVS